MEDTKSPHSKNIGLNKDSSKFKEENPQAADKAERNSARMKEK